MFESIACIIGSMCLCIVRKNAKVEPSWDDHFRKMTTSELKTYNDHCNIYGRVSY